MSITPSATQWDWIVLSIHKIEVLIAARASFSRCCESVSCTATAIRILGWVAFGLDLAAFLLALLILFILFFMCLYCSDVTYERATGSVAAIVVVVHLSVGLMVVRSTHAIKRLLNPVSSGIVSIDERERLLPFDGRRVEVGRWCTI